MAKPKNMPDSIALATTSGNYNGMPFPLTNPLWQGYRGGHPKSLLGEAVYVQFFTNMFLTMWTVVQDIVSEEAIAAMHRYMLFGRHCALVKLGDVYTVSLYTADTEKVDRFGNPLEITLQSEHPTLFDGMRLKRHQFVLLRNSPCVDNMYLYFQEMANVLDELDRAYITNIQYQKVPYLLAAEQGTDATVRTVLAMRSASCAPEEFVVGVNDPIALGERIVRVPLDSPFLLEQLRKEKEGILAQTLEKIGIKYTVTPGGETYVNEMNSVYFNDRANAHLQIMKFERDRIEREVKTRFNETFAFKYARGGAAEDGIYNQVV